MRQLGSTAIGLLTREGVILAVEKVVTSPLLVRFLSILPHRQILESILSQIALLLIAISNMTCALLLIAGNKEHREDSDD